MNQVPEGKEIDPEYNYDDREEVTPPLNIHSHKLGIMGRKKSSWGKSTYKSKSDANKGLSRLHGCSFAAWGDEEVGVRKVWLNFNGCLFLKRPVNPAEFVAYYLL